MRSGWTLICYGECYNFCFDRCILAWLKHDWYGYFGSSLWGTCWKSRLKYGDCDVRCKQFLALTPCLQDEVYAIT